jgi:hypothetical protein
MVTQQYLLISIRQILHFDWGGLGCQDWRIPLHGMDWTDYPNSVGQMVRVLEIVQELVPIDVRAPSERRYG